jgi:putative copper export protein
MLLGAGSVGFVAAFGGPTPPATVPMLLAAAALALGLVPMQAGLLIGLPPGDVPLAAIIAAGLSMPVVRFGLLCGGLLLVPAVLLRRWPVSAALAALAAVGDARPLGPRGNGRAALARLPALALHAGLAAFWASALLPLHASVRRLPLREAAGILAAFSRRAVPGVAALVLAGGVLMAIQIRCPSGSSPPTARCSR